MIPCLQHDGTSWRYGPKRLSDVSAMKRLKIIHMESSARKKLLEKKESEIVVLTKRLKELEEECRMLSYYGEM